MLLNAPLEVNVWSYNKEAVLPSPFPKVWKAVQHANVLFVDFRWSCKWHKLYLLTYWCCCGELYRFPMMAVVSLKIWKYLKETEIFMQKVNFDGTFTKAGASFNNHLWFRIIPLMWTKCYAGSQLWQHKEVWLQMWNPWVPLEIKMYLLNAFEWLQPTPLSFNFFVHFHLH